MSPVAWLFTAFVAVIFGAPVLGAAVYSMTTEKAHEMIWTPLKAWVGAHPLIFRSIVIALGCAVVSRFIWWLGWAGLMIWAGLLAWRHRDWLVFSVKRLFAGARVYRYDGEKDAHATQLRETQISLGLMASAATDDDNQLRMATDIEHGAEERLCVLLAKPRLTLEEKRERDAIEREIKRQRTARAPAAPQGFLGALAAAPVLGGPMMWIGGILVAWGLGASGVAWERGVRLEHVKDELHRQADAARAWRDRSQQQQAALNAAREQSQASAQTIEQERERSRAYARQQARMRDAIRQVDSGGDPPDWGIGVRDAGAAPGGAAAGGADRNPG
jgi:hypothetical protein